MIIKRFKVRIDYTTKDISRQEVFAPDEETALAIAKHHFHQTFTDKCEFKKATIDE